MMSGLSGSIFQRAPYIPTHSAMVANNDARAAGSIHAARSAPILASKHLIYLNVSQLYLCIESAVKSELYISQ